jgi:signal transduction histidine kinase
MMPNNLDKDRPNDTGQIDMAAPETEAFQRLMTALKGMPAVFTQQDSLLRYRWIHRSDGCPPENHWIGRTDLEVLERREDARALEKLKRRVLETGTPTRTEVTLHKKGVKHYYDLNIQPLYDASSRPAGIVCAMIDMTEHKRAQENEHRQLQVAEALSDTAIVLTGTLDLSEVLYRILVNVERVVPHDAADILLVDKGVAEIVRSRGYTQNGVESHTLALRFAIANTPPLRWMAENMKPLIIPDIRFHSEWTKLPQEDWQRAYAGVPIQLQDKLIGFLTLYSTTPNFFSEHQVHYLQAFAAQAAIAIHNAQMHQNARDVAAANERFRLASELHDSVNQMLFSSSIIAEALLKMPSNNRQVLNAYLNRLQRLNRGALAEMRMLLMDMRSEQTLDVNLPTQLRRLVDAVQGRDEINIGLIIEGDYRMPSDVRHALYQISQDALNLMVEQANSKQATLHLKSFPGRVELHIKDDQSNFSLTQGENPLPLETLRKSAEAVRADFQMRSEDGRGTHISVTWTRAG